MAGVKGKSGGPRKNSGGARPGAGRKPRADPSKSAKEMGNGAAVETTMELQAGGGALKRSKATAVPMAEMDMLAMLQAVALGKVDATTVQVRAAIAAVQYTHLKKGDGGKKEEQAEKAKQVGSKFAPAAAPRLAAAGGKRL